MQKEKMAKRIPYGKKEYDILIKNNYYYVDKTKYIEYIEDSNNTCLFFLRPRRFGKSLLLSTLECYYDINREDQFDTLFKDTYIGKNATSFKNSYYILRLDFSEIDTDADIKTIQDNFDVNIYNSICNFYVYYKNIMGGEEKFYKEFPAIRSGASLIDIFFKIIKRRNIKLYLLIDEYDNFANNILMDIGQDSYEKITHSGGFLKSFFKNVKSAVDKSVERLFVTGVSPLVLSDVTSGMNIGKNISFNNKLNSMIGFNDDEVCKILDYYISEGKVKKEDKEEIKRIFKEYYNNYCFSEKFDERVYNPNMIFYFLDSYIENNSISSNVLDSNFSTDYTKLKYMILINKESFDNFDVLLTLLVEGQVKEKLEDKFSISAINNTTQFTSLLYYLGLVTVKEVNEFSEYTFIVPNEAVREIEYEYITNALDDVVDFDGAFFKDIAKSFKKMAYDGDWNDALETLTNMYYKSTSLRDLSKKELALKIFVFALLTLNIYHKAKSEMELERGYADIYLRSNPKLKIPTKYEYIIEFKYISSKDETVTHEIIESKKNEAIKQLNKYEESNEIKEAKELGKIVKKIVVIGASQQIVLMQEV